MTPARVAAIAEEISDLRVLSTNRQIALAQLALLAEPGKLERAAAAAKLAGVTTELVELRTQVQALAALKASTAETRNASATQVAAMTAELAELRGRVAALEAPAAEARAATTTQFAEVTTELGELRTQVQALDEPIAQARQLAPRVGQVTDGLADLLRSWTRSEHRRRR